MKEAVLALLFFGGSKISTKIKIVDFYLNKFDKVLIGGAMANTFLVAKGKEIGSSIIEKSMVKTAKEYLENFSEKIILPTDCVLSTKTKEISVKAIDMIDKDEKILDIGPQSRMLFYNEILECENLLWNGPLGFFEEKPFNEAQISF